MPAPSAATYSSDALVAATTSFRDLVDSGSGAGLIRIRDAADTLLGTIVLQDPCGTINSTTGQLTLLIATNVTSAIGGTAAYGEVCTSAGAVKLAMPCLAGTSAVSGYFVLNTLTVVTGGQINVVSAVIG